MNEKQESKKKIDSEVDSLKNKEEKIKQAIGLNEVLAHAKKTILETELKDVNEMIEKQNTIITEQTKQKEDKSSSIDVKRNCALKIDAAKKEKEKLEKEKTELNAMIIKAGMYLEGKSTTAFNWFGSVSPAPEKAEASSKPSSFFSWFSKGNPEDDQKEETTNNESNKEKEESESKE